MSKLESLLEDYEKALTRLKEVLALPKNDVVRDSAIKRFEIVFDLAWKTSKTWLEEYHNARCTSPRDCFKEAFRQKLIEYDDFWIELTSIRNYTTHIYSEALSNSVFKDLPKTAEYFQKLLDSIKDKSSDK